MDVALHTCGSCMYVGTRGGARIPARNITREDLLMWGRDMWRLVSLSRSGAVFPERVREGEERWRRPLLSVPSRDGCTRCGKRKQPTAASGELGSPVGLTSKTVLFTRLRAEHRSFVFGRCRKEAARPSCWLLSLLGARTLPVLYSYSNFRNHAPCARGTRRTTTSRHQPTVPTRNQPSRACATNLQCSAFAMLGHLFSKENAITILHPYLYTLWRYLHTF